MRIPSYRPAILLGLVCLWGAQSVASPADKRIAHLTPTLAAAFNSQVARSLTMRSELLGMSVTTFSAAGKSEQQARQLEEAIAQRYDLIVLAAGRDEAAPGLLRRAREAGIPVVLLTTPPADGVDDLFVSFIGEDRRELGRVAGEAMLDALRRSGREGGNIAVIAGPLNQAEAALRLEGFKQAVAANPKIKIVTVEDAGWASAMAVEAAKRLLDRHGAGGGLDAVYAMADQQAVAVIDAAHAAGVQTGGGEGQLIVLASSCFKSGIAMIKAGRQHSTVTMIPARTGWLSAELIADYFNGKTPPKRKILPAATVERENAELWEAACSF